MKVPRKHRIPKKPRSYNVDGRRYSISISDAARDRDGIIPLRVSFRAEYGSRSVCLVRGLTNRSFWHDYPNIEQLQAEVISLTPKIVCALIRLAHQCGWDPDASKSNFELSADRDLIRKLTAES